jgi:peptide deformylase
MVSASVRLRFATCRLQIPLHVGVFMALLPILVYPDPKLHTVACAVDAVDDAVRTLVGDMFDTMYEAKGVGLAATQIDVHRRIVVMDVSESRNERVVLINPEIEWLSEERISGEEGCLSVPGTYDGVERAAQVRVRALDENGNSRVIEADGLMAVCIQHEIDHLNGKVFVEYLSPLKRNRIKTKLLKAKREAARTAEPAYQAWD